jgi:hypothetical protein
MAETTGKNYISPIKKFFRAFFKGNKHDKEARSEVTSNGHVPTHAVADHEKTTAQIPLSDRMKAEPESVHSVSEGKPDAIPAESATGKMRRENAGKWRR